MPAELSPEAQRLLDARTEGVAELKAIDNVERTITDPNVVRLASARLFEQSLTMRMLGGEAISASELKSATDMVADARDALPPQPLAVTLTVVKSHIGIVCPHCHREIKASEMVDPEPTDAPIENAQPSKQTPSNVVSLPERMGLSESKFHDQRGVPLKKLQPSVDPRDAVIW
jgi:hypothetical protein